MIVLHDGYHEFGRGDTEEAAILDAIQNCHPQGGDLVPVTREWIERELARGSASSICGTGLVLEELDVDDLDGES